MPDIGRQSTFLEAAEAVLRADRRPLSSRELVARAIERGLISTKGRAPHKTMNARLSEDIRENPQTIFMRSFHGTFALKDWSSEIREFVTKRRKINPMDENILVLEESQFRSLLSVSARLVQRPFFDISLGELLSKSISMKRQLIEEDNSYVQIISLFHVISNDEILTYKRTSRLPESRLHYTKSVNFGGHLQDIDRAPIFETVLQDDINVVFMRELYEELVFENGFESVRYLGALYSEDDSFSARHVAVCFQVIPRGQSIRSNEPGFHTGVRFELLEEVEKSKSDFDEWTFLVLRRAGLVT